MSRGFSSTSVLRRNSATLGDLVGRGGRKAPDRVTVEHMQVTSLSSLVGDAKFSLLATHLIHVCHFADDTHVQYGRSGRFKSIVIEGAEYQEKEGKIYRY